MDNIRNFIQLTENIGTAGQPMAEQFAVIAKNGFQHVINLAMPDHPDAIENEGALVAEQGMSYLHIPVPFDQPTAHHVRLFCNFLSGVKHDNVFVHCIMNYRVSAFMFHYLHKCEGWAAADARSPMFETWEVDSVWSDLINLKESELGLNPRHVKKGRG